MSAFLRTVSIVAAIDGLKFFAANGANKARVFGKATVFLNRRMNFLVLVFRDKLKIRDVVVVLVEVAVMNFVTVGNFAVEVRPNETVKPYRADKTPVIIFVKRKTVASFSRVADGFNRQHVAFDLANQFFDSERFLRCLDALAQQLEKFFFVFHDNASEILTNSRQDVRIKTQRRLDGS